jgi:hypothetical protein
MLEEQVGVISTKQQQQQIEIDDTARKMSKTSKRQVS